MKIIEFADLLSTKVRIGRVKRLNKRNRDSVVYKARRKLEKHILVDRQPVEFFFFFQEFSLQKSGTHFIPLFLIG